MENHKGKNHCGKESTPKSARERQPFRQFGQNLGQTSGFFADADQRAVKDTKGPGVNRHGFRESGTCRETAMEILKEADPTTRKAGLRGLEGAKNRNPRRQERRKITIKLDENLGHRSGYGNDDIWFSHMCNPSVKRITKHDSIDGKRKLGREGSIFFGGNN